MVIATVWMLCSSHQRLLPTSSGWTGRRRRGLRLHSLTPLHDWSVRKGQAVTWHWSAQEKRQGGSWFLCVISDWRSASRSKLIRICFYCTWLLICRNTSSSPSKRFSYRSTRKQCQEKHCCFGCACVFACVLCFSPKSSWLCHFSGVRTSAWMNNINK